MSRTDKNKAKIVLIVGNDLPREEIEKEIQKNFPNDNDNIIFIGEGEKISNELDLSAIRYRTDEDTLFITYTHGMNTNDGHGPTHSNITTGNFLKKLKDIAGHKITVAMESCRVGRMLKRNEVESDDISIFAEAGSKYQTLTAQNTKSVMEFVSKKLSGQTNEEIFSSKIASRPETIYFLPFSKQVVSSLESKSDSKEVSEVKSSGYKFSRPGKFSLDEISKILKSVYGEKIEEHFQKFIESKKTDFSINRIKEILELDNKNLEEKNSEKLKFRNDLLEKFREELQNKLTETKIEEFFKARQNKFNEIIGINNSFTKIDYKDAISDFWFMAALRGYEEEISAILKNYPDFINKENNRGYTENNRGYNALKYATENVHFEIVQKLIRGGADVNWVDNDGQSILMYAATTDLADISTSFAEGKYALAEFIKILHELINAGIDINLVDKDGKSALILATIEKNHWEIALKLIEANANLNLIDKDGRSALIWVMINNDVNSRPRRAVIEKLTATSNTINLIDKDGKSALTWASEKKDWISAIELIRAGAIEKDDDLVLIKSIKDIEAVPRFVRNFYFEKVLELINYGARIDLVDEQGRSALILAINQQYYEMIEPLIAKGIDINITGKDGKSAITIAIQKKEWDIVLLLIKDGALLKGDESNLIFKGMINNRINYSDYFSEDSDDVSEIIKKLIDSGANVNQVNEKGKSVLIWAIEKGNWKAALDLLKIGVKEKNNDLILIQVIKNINSSGYDLGIILKEFIKAGAKIDLVDEKGKSALMWAIDEDTDFKACLELAKAGANVNLLDKKGKSVLMRIKSGKVKQLLLKAAGLSNTKIEINIEGKKDDSDIESESDIEEIEDYLEENEVIGRKNNHNLTELMKAAKKKNLSSSKTLKTLIKLGEEIEERDQNGCTALIHAVKGNVNNIEYLLRVGANIEAKDNKGLTALIYAAQTKNVDNLLVLINAGADIELKDSEGRTALMRAIEKGETELATNLLFCLLNRYSASPDVHEEKDNNGMTALMLAVKMNNKEIVQIYYQLFSQEWKYIDINAKDNEGRTALMWAIKNNNSEIAEILRDAGAKEEIQINKVSINTKENQESKTEEKKDNNEEVIIHVGKSLIGEEETQNNQTTSKIRTKSQSPKKASIKPMKEQLTERRNR